MHTLQLLLALPVKCSPAGKTWEWCQEGVRNGAQSWAEWVIHETLTCCCATLQQWDINEKLPDEVEGPFHVAVATNVLHTGNNLKSEHPPSWLTVCSAVRMPFSCLSFSHAPSLACDTMEDPAVKLMPEACVYCCKLLIKTPYERASRRSHADNPTQLGQQRLCR